MKKYWPYIAGFLVILTLVVLLSNNTTRSRSFNDTVTLKKEHTIPYGTYAARKLLPSLFPDAEISVYKGAKDEWDQWDAIAEETNLASISICKSFFADEEELYQVLRWVKNGNYYFISAQSLSDEAAAFFNVSVNTHTFYSVMEDSLQLRLETPPFKTNQPFKYPGRKFENWAYSIDSSKTTVLGRNEDGVPNFIRFDAGKGSIFIHLAPLAFSNYFLLHKNNIAYYQQALSVIPENVDKVIWNEYYSNKPRQQNNDNEEKNPSFLRVLMKYPPFKWGLWIAILTILVYTLMEMRRKQRFIPTHTRPQNDSLDFIKTIGRLYHDRKDHHNLAKKMGSYFLEHVRSNYKLPTHTLDEKFVQALHYKSGYDQSELNVIIQTIQNLGQTDHITEQQLSNFYKQLENFYGTT